MEQAQRVSRQIGKSGYYISSLGEVFSYKSGEMKGMVTCLNKGGYETISLVIDGIRKNYHPHRLVAEYFIDKGIEARRITFQSFGACCPLEMELINGRNNPDGRSRNRRALINISKE